METGCRHLRFHAFDETFAAISSMRPSHKRIKLRIHVFGSRVLRAFGLFSHIIFCSFIYGLLLGAVCWARACRDILSARSPMPCSKTIAVDSDWRPSPWVDARGSRSQFPRPASAKKQCSGEGGRRKKSKHDLQFLRAEGSGSSSPDRTVGNWLCCGPVIGVGLQGFP